MNRERGAGHAHFNWTLHDDAPFLANHLRHDHGIEPEDHHTNVAAHFVEHDNRLAAQPSEGE